MIKSKYLLALSHKTKLLLVFSIFCSSYFIYAQNNPVRDEVNGIVIIEAENTSSELGEWNNIMTNIDNFTGTGYIEFDGNSPINGNPNSPLTYQFKINEAGLYFLHLRCARETLTINGEVRTDVANDCYVRVEGDYQEGASVGDNHGDDAPLETLMNDTKFFGGNNLAFVWASGNRLDLGGEVNKRVAAYNFKENETYTLVVSGRSQFFKIDRFLFRKETVNSNTAQSLTIEETFVEDQNDLSREDSIFDKESIVIRPNPTSDLLTIESTIELKKIQLFTLQGKKLNKTTVRDNSIDLSNLASGSYILKIFTVNKGIITKKIIRE